MSAPRPFTVGINLWSQATSWPDFLAAAQLADRLGYEHLWTWDHLHAIIGDPQQDIFEAYTTLGAWASATKNIRLGLMVGANTFRNPGLVAKSIATLDHASNGRAILGIGGAWFDYEHEHHGFEFGASVGERLDWLDESVAAVRALLDGKSVTSPTGGHYHFSDLKHAPLPIQKHLPIMIGGNGRTKTLRTIARNGDMWNGFGTAAVLQELDGVLREHCATEGRDQSDIVRTSNLWIVIRDTVAEAQAVWEAQAKHNKVDVASITEPGRPLLGPPEVIAAALREYAAAGFHCAIVEIPAPYDHETLERLAGEVLPMVNGTR
jgi:alkanesulfonate monooxygenase SsuD/methylene tetrahydromethanopterin reductase-like flavin-dependent oxidoreductase (luciferase family)